MPSPGSVNSDSASEIQGMNLPGYRLHELKGDRKGTWAVTVRGNWRITFALKTAARVSWTSRTTMVNKERNEMQMKNPSHPGRIVRDECLEPLSLTVTEGAKVLGVSRQALNNLVNEKAGISAEMAVRLAKAFGSTAETWLRMQVAYDLARVPLASIHVKPYRKAAA
jgi:addiction module HigA family antidote